jgi:nuclear transport factor 2 (NTF2) superfamily protein
MRRRFACINDMPIKESERKFHWPLGRRPDDHPVFRSWVCKVIAYLM